MKKKQIIKKWQLFSNAPVTPPVTLGAAIPSGFQDDPLDLVKPRRRVELWLGIAHFYRVVKGFQGEGSLIFPKVPQSSQTESLGFPSYPP